MCELLLLLHENAICNGSKVMADNYLEKKMDEYRRGMAVKPTRRHLTPSGNRPGTVSMKIEALRVLVTDAANDFSAAIVRRLREVGCRVAFVSADDKAGRTLAQATGSRYYPSSFVNSAVADLTDAWGGLDAVIITDGSMPRDVDLSALKRMITVGSDPAVAELTHRDGMTVNAVSTGGRTPADVAHLCLLLCLTASDCLNRRIL